MGISICSLLESNKGVEEITIHILENSLLEENKEKITKIVKDYNRSVVFYDFSDIQERLGNYNIPTTIAISAYNRLFLPTILDTRIDKVLYLDSDSIVVGNLTELWNIDIHDYEVAGVLDHVRYSYKEAIGLDENTNYINSGFALFNLNKCRTENATQRILDFIKYYNGNVAHHDQGIINGVFKESMLILPPQYNLMTSAYELSASEIRLLFNTSAYYTQEQMDEAKAHPVFIHYTPSFSRRPWIKGCTHPLKNLYLEYKEKTPWRDEPIEKDKRPFKYKLLEHLFKILGVKLYKQIVELR